MSCPTGRSSSCEWPDLVADISNYAGREQAFVKHYFLESYLEVLIHKTASSYNEIAYVDGFSGPWQSKGENYADTSFGIALAALRKAKASWKARGRDVRMSAHLVEQAAGAYDLLEAIKPRFPDIDIRTYNADFVATAPSINSAIPRTTFAFVLVDPKGWRIDIRRLAPLLSRPNCEVVFNFMFDFINRAASINDPGIVNGLAELIPYGDWRDQLRSLEQGGGSPAERKRILAEAFRVTLAKVGDYKYVAEVPVLRPVKNRVLYSLFYATRHATGIKVFRDCHLKTERQQASVRVGIRRAHEEATSGQTSLFDRDTEASFSVERMLQAERSAAQATVLSLLPVAPRYTTYGEVWPHVLERHMVTLAEVNKIAADLRKRQLLSFPDWEFNKRVPADSYKVSRTRQPSPADLQPD
jgi:three-Cys-motif partner protein